MAVRMWKNLLILFCTLIAISACTKSGNSSALPDVSPVTYAPGSEAPIINTDSGPVLTAVPATSAAAPAPAVSVDYLGSQTD
jgi:hypothetical protein